MLKGLDFVILIVPDVDQAVQFYSENLGLEPDEAFADPGTFIQFKAPAAGAVLAVSKRDNAAPYTGVALWWQTDDVDGLYEQLAARPVEVVTPPTDRPFGRILVIKDPAGHMINFYQNPPAA